MRDKVTVKLSWTAINRNDFLLPPIEKVGYISVTSKNAPTTNIVSCTFFMCERKINPIQYFQFYIKINNLL